MREIKIGDYLVYKKKSNKDFTKNKKYEILNISHSGIKPYPSLTVKNNYNGYRYFTVVKTKVGNTSYEDFFYTQKEMRKLKLDKINNGN